MRLRIVHQLSLLMLGGVLLAVAAVGGVVVWNLQTGFSDYLRARDEQQLNRFVQVVAERATGLADPAQGSAALPMRELMDEFLHREGLTPPADWRPPQRRDRPPPPENSDGRAVLHRRALAYHPPSGPTPRHPCAPGPPGPMA